MGCSQVYVECLVALPNEKVTLTDYEGCACSGWGCHPVTLLGSADSYIRSLESLASLGSCLLFEMFFSLANSILEILSQRILSILFTSP